MYTEMLQEKGFTDTAARSYAEASERSLKANKILEFLVFKVLQWRISPPEKLEAKRVLAEIKRNMGQELPLNKIFNKLSHQEIIAFLSRFAFVYMPAGQVLKKIGDMEDSLYFVVSGTLRDSIFVPIENNEKVYRKPIIFLTENDFFGNIYPFEEEKKFKSYIESMDQVVLIKISRMKLIQLCQKYPKIESGLINLYQIRKNIDANDLFVNLRRSQRFILKRRLNLVVNSKTSTKESIYLNGFTSDISIGGLRFNLDEESYNLSLSNPAFSDMVGKADVQINISDEGMSLNFQGRVVWLREVSFEGRKTLALGIQFENLPPKLKGLLIALFNGLGLNSKNL
jgi:CRP-like cAMP-binding protein